MCDHPPLASVGGAGIVSPTIHYGRGSQPYATCAACGAVGQVAEDMSIVWPGQTPQRGVRK